SSRRHTRFSRDWSSDVCSSDLSPAFIMHTENGSTLMIPSVFMSWTGEALDKKIPLLRSNAAMDKAARKVLTLMGEEEIAPLNSKIGRAPCRETGQAARSGARAR